MSVQYHSVIRCRLQRPVCPKADSAWTNARVAGEAGGDSSRSLTSVPLSVPYLSSACAYPRADSPDRPPTTGRNYLQPQQIISSQSRKLPADITELAQPLEVPAGPAPSHGFAISCFRAPPGGGPSVQNRFNALLDVIYSGIFSHSTLLGLKNFAEINRHEPSERTLNFKIRLLAGPTPGV
jgi:hypothetical protein